MDAAERHTRIVDYLRIKPISHGQIYTFQIAVPPSEVVEIPLDRLEHLSSSLTQQGTNLIPLIVRRTEEYSEEEEYELVYGVDWYIVAKKLDIEKLWVWVFNMTDEQAITAKQEMQQLLGFSSPPHVELPSASGEIESNQIILKKIDYLCKELITLNQKVDQAVTLSQKSQIATDEKLSLLVTEAIKNAIVKAQPEVEAKVISKREEQTTQPPQPQIIGIENLTLSALKVLAAKHNIKGRSNMNKNQLVIALKKIQVN